MELPVPLRAVMPTRLQHLTPYLEALGAWQLLVAEHVSLLSVSLTGLM